MIDFLNNDIQDKKDFLKELPLKTKRNKVSFNETLEQYANEYNEYNVFNEDNVVFRFCSYKNQMPLGFEMKATEAVFMTILKLKKKNKIINYLIELIF